MLSALRKTGGEKDRWGQKKPDWEASNRDSRLGKKKGVVRPTGEW